MTIQTTKTLVISGVFIMQGGVTGAQCCCLKFSFHILSSINELMALKQFATEFYLLFSELSWISFLDGATVPSTTLEMNLKYLSRVYHNTNENDLNQIA